MKNQYSRKTAIFVVGFVLGILVAVIFVMLSNHETERKYLIEENGKGSTSYQITSDSLSVDKKNEVAGTGGVDTETKKTFTDNLIDKLVDNDESESLSRLIITGRIGIADDPKLHKAIKYLRSKQSRNAIMAVLTYYEQINWVDSEVISEYLSRVFRDHSNTIIEFLYQDRPHLFGFISEYIIKYGLEEVAYEKLGGHMPLHKLILLLRKPKQFYKREEHENLLDKGLYDAYLVLVGKPSETGGMLTSVISEPESIETPCVSKGKGQYRISKYEITNEQFYSFIKSKHEWSKENIDPSKHDGNYLRLWNANGPPMGKAFHPVTYVSWYAADAYCRWRGGRLPTELEWMAAAACSVNGREQKYPWGDEFDRDKCNVSFQIGTTAPVGYHEGKSEYGAYDLCGNVWEWTNTNNDGFYVMKGGSWGGYTRVDAQARQSYRGLVQRTGNHIGFRCVWTDM